jgi:serine/threonine protein kinase
LPAGTLLLERYRIDLLLGRGGFGITYRARDTRLHRDVAIKELFPPAAVRRGAAVVVADADRPGFSTARARFQREAATLARFNHPGIVRIFEVFEANDTAYLVMELIDGSSVGELLRARGAPFEVDEVLDLVLRVGGALGAVHESGLLHRDVNPSNLVVDGTRRVVLIDFGLARRYGDDISGSVTRAVTPGYAPPEQYAGSARIGPPCDVFGLAATAYKLLTGTTPTNVFDRQAGAALPAPAAVRPDIPALVSAAILDGMELDPGHRPATTEAFLNRLGLFDASPAPTVALATSHPDETRWTPPRAEPDGSPVREGGPDREPGRPVDAQARAVPVAGPPASTIAGPVARPTPAPVPAAVDGPAVAVAAASAVGGNSSFAPWHDGSPPVIGPGDRRRGWVTWPVGIALVVLSSASPLIVSVLVGLIVLPLLATRGDLEVHRHRRRIGAQRRKWHDARPAIVGPVRFVRNVVMGAARALPAVALAAIGFATERVFSDTTFDPLWRDLVIRSTGVAMALVLLVPARHPGRGYRTDLGITSWAGAVMEGRRRPGTRAFVVWVIALAATAFGAWLGPELWPLT